MEKRGTINKTNQNIKYVAKSSKDRTGINLCSYNTTNTAKLKADKNNNKKVDEGGRIQNIAYKNNLSLI